MKQKLQLKKKIRNLCIPNKVLLFWDNSQTLVPRFNEAENEAILGPIECNIQND